MYPVFHEDKRYINNISQGVGSYKWTKINMINNYGKYTYIPIYLPIPDQTSEKNKAYVPNDVLWNICISNI